MSPAQLENLINKLDSIHLTLERILDHLQNLLDHLQNHLDTPTSDLAGREGERT